MTIVDALEEVAFGLATRERLTVREQPDDAIARALLSSYFQSILDQRYDLVVVVARKAYLLFEAVRGDLSIPTTTTVCADRALEFGRDALPAQVRRAAVVDDTIYSGSSLLSAYQLARGLLPTTEIDCYSLWCSNNSTPDEISAIPRRHIERLCSPRELSSATAATVRIIQQTHGAYLCDYPRFEVFDHGSTLFADGRSVLRNTWHQIDLTNSAQANSGVRSAIALLGAHGLSDVQNAWSRLGLTAGIESVQLRWISRPSENKYFIPKVRLQSCTRRDLDQAARVLNLPSADTITDRGQHFRIAYSLSLATLGVCEGLGLLPIDDDSISTRNLARLEALFGAQNAELVQVESLRKRLRFQVSKRTYRRKEPNRKVDRLLGQAFVGSHLDPVLALEAEMLFGEVRRDNPYDPPTRTVTLDEIKRVAANYDGSGSDQIAPMLVAHCNDAGVAVPVLRASNDRLEIVHRSGENATLARNNTSLVATYLRSAANARTPDAPIKSLAASEVDLLVGLLING